MCEASSAEENAYAIFAALELDMDAQQTRGKSRLFKTALEKALFSSPAACLHTIDSRLKKLRQKYADDEIKDIRRLEELADALKDITPTAFSRYQKLGVGKSG